MIQMQDAFATEIETKKNSHLKKSLQCAPKAVKGVCVHIYKDKTCVLPEGFEPESFQLKYNPPTFEYKIHSVEIDPYYFKYL